MAFKPKYKKSVSKPTVNNVTVDEIDMDNIFDPEKIYDQLMSLREYQEAGEVVNPNNPVQLKEVTIKEKRLPKPITSYGDYIASKHQDDNLGEAMFLAPLDAILSFPQAYATKLATGKYQTPSEAWGYKQPKGFAQHAGNFVMDAVADPLNLAGVGLLDDGFKLGNRFLRKKPFISENVDLKLWNIFNKKKPKPFLPPSLNAESELARANADALAFSQSPYNKTKLQEFRPKQDFNVTNTEALFHNDPVAREKFAKLMNDDSHFLKYRNIENWQGVSEGNYGARYFGDINDVAIVNKNKPQSKIYNAAIHETGHSRSVRLPATNEEREILDDAWKGLKEVNGSYLSPLEAEAVQGELRMLLGDKLGKRVFTKVDEGEIKTALKKMIADNHPYVQSINDFDVSKIIKSLNKIGLVSIVGVGAGLLNEKKYGGNINKYQRGGQTNPPIYVSNVNDPRLKSYSDSLKLYNKGEKDYIKYLQTNKYYNIPDRATRIENNPVVYDGDVLAKIQPIKSYRYWYNHNPDLISYTDLPSNIVPKWTDRYKKPVQPYIYQKNPTLKKLPNVGINDKITIKGTPINYSPNVFMQPQTNIPTQRGVSGGWQIINGEWKRVPYNVYQQGGETNYYPPKEVMINEGSSYYNPSSEIVYINPNDKRDNTDASRQHELFHHYQNINGNLQLPQFYNGPLKRPNMMMNQDIQSAYYNRGNVDETLMYNQMIQENPDWQFMPRDLLYKGYQLQSGRYVPGTSDMLYQTPWTAEGEAQRYEDDVRNGMNPLFKNGGYTVVRSNDRKGKTHKVTGPDGTVKYFGDSKLGQHPKDPERKKAFYARHKQNLANNPYFRAFARKTWKEGGSVTLNTGGEKHRIYVKPTNAGEGVKGHIMVNHPTMDKGIWDTIDLTQKAGVTTIAQGVAATKKWHMENPYKKQIGGNINKLGVENSLWNNIRANRGSGKKPTKQMLQQERKIKNK